MPDNKVIEPPSFREALAFWSKLGWISFGGTAGHIAIMHDYLVVRKKWISNARFLHALSHCMLLPGPEAQQLAIYIGWQLHGKKGGLIAGLLFVLPSMFILLALSVVYALYGNVAWMSATFSGLKPAVVALVILALFRVGQRALRGPLHVAVALGAFVAMYFFTISLPLIMLAVAILAIAVNYCRPSMFHAAQPIHEDEDESGYCISETSATKSSGFSTKSALALIAIVLSLWLAPLALFYLFTDDFLFWETLSLFFTKTAFVTIGGSYTVIPYVAHLSVYKLHWLTNLEMTDGFALAETTPGPLIIVLAFVGFMAGYHHFHGSILMGAIALLATTFYTFLPCFLFVFLGAPLVERTRGSRLIEGMLGLITAVVVGAILDLTFFLGKSALVVPGRTTGRHVSNLSLAWMIVVLILMKALRINVIYIVILSVVFGMICHLHGLMP
jgi:chromate transporter